MKMEHLSPTQIQQYASGELPPQEMLETDDHLSGCEACRRNLMESGRIKSRLAQWPLALLPDSAGHLAYEDLMLYVENHLDGMERGIVDAHLQSCPECIFQFRELQKARTDSMPSRSSYIENAKVLWYSPQFSTPFRVVSAAAIAAFVGLILLLVAPRPNQHLQAQLKSANEQAEKARQELQQTRSQVQELTNQIASLQNPPSAMASLQDHGKLISVDQMGKFNGGEELPAAYRQLASAALKDGNVPLPSWIRELHGQPGTLMGAGSEENSLRVLSPVGVVVESARPEFTWKPLGANSRYKVKVYDSDFHLVTESNPTTNTSWIPPKDLPRGNTYTWVVAARRGDSEVMAPQPPSPEAKFKVLEQAKLRDLKEFERKNSHFLLGLAYADAGLLEQAKREFQSLQKENPNSPLAARLLKSVDRP